MVLTATYHKDFHTLRFINRRALLSRADNVLGPKTYSAGNCVYGIYFTPLFIYLIFDSRLLGLTLAGIAVLRYWNRTELVPIAYCLGFVEVFLQDNPMTTVIGLEVLATLMTFILISNLYTSCTDHNTDRTVNILMLNSIAFAVLTFGLTFFYLKFGANLGIFKPSYKPFWIIYFLVKFGNILVYGTKNVLYESTNGMSLLIITTIQIVLVPILVLNNVGCSELPSPTWIHALLAVLCVFGMYQVFFISNMKNLILYTTTLTNIFGIIFIAL